jgi:hypothetical protein
MIAWGLRAGFAGREPYHFYVDVGRGSDEWTTLNDLPLINECMTVDSQRRHWDQLADFYYRVRLVTPSETDPSTGQSKVYLSQPQQANGLWSRRDWLMAREIARREYLMQRKRTNVTATGTLLKRRKFGAACERCKEYDTGEVQNATCPYCFGTGISSGFYRGVDFTVMLDAPWDRDLKRDETVGNRRDVVRSARAVAYPYIENNDVFVRNDSGERFYVNAVKTLAELGGIPVVVQVELRLAPTTDIVYTVPLTGSSSSSSSSSSTAPQEWRSGLRADADY